LPNPNSGKYVIVLSPGTYDINIEATGFQSVMESMTILDKSSFRFEITKDVKLLPEGYQKK